MNINTPDTFTDAVLVQGGKRFDVSVSGSFQATVVLQRSKDGAVWRDLRTMTEPTEFTDVGGTAWCYRVGVKADAYTSGTVAAEFYG